MALNYLSNKRYEVNSLLFKLLIANGFVSKQLAAHFESQTAVL